MAFRTTEVTPAQILLPVMLIALTTFGLVAFQMTAILMERSNLKATHTAQTEQVDQAKKVQVQLDALVTGTMGLADKGNKDAQGVLSRLKQAGVTFTSNPPEGQAAAPAEPAPKK